MFDIHYHLLFGLDDGPKTLEASLQLAEASIAEGVTHIVCTPHANHRYAFRPALNRERLAILEERLGGRVKLGLGCDFHLSYDNIEDVHLNRKKYTINQQNYLLVEFPDAAISPYFSETFYQFNVAGIVPIITHPERNQMLMAHPERMAEWMRGGCLIQVTAASLLGRFGKRCQAMAENLVKKNWVHFIASDAHSIENRPPAMADAYNALKNGFGQEVADRLCIHNPRAAYLGEPLPPQPDPLDLYQDRQPRPGFLRGLFRR